MLKIQPADQRIKLQLRISLFNETARAKISHRSDKSAIHKIRQLKTSN
ncbi:hypothetical protein [Rheinheimera sp.]